MSLRRIRKELKDVNKQKDNIENIVSAGPIDVKDIYAWKAVVKGPSDSPYENGIFTLTINFPIDYPFAPPKLKFKTKIFHPNINDVGKICLDIIDNLTAYSPALTIVHILLSIVSLLAAPNHNDPLAPEVSNLYFKDPEAYVRTAREYTTKFAISNKE